MNAMFTTTSGSWTTTAASWSIEFRQDGDDGSAGVREPNRPRPTAPAAAMATTP